MKTKLPPILVVDANILFSFFKEDSTRRHLIKELPKKGCKLITPYFALALSLKASIWSDEKAFKKQSVVNVFSTSELISNNLENVFFVSLTGNPVFHR